MIKAIIIPSRQADQTHSNRDTYDLSFTRPSKVTRETGQVHASVAVNPLVFPPLTHIFKNSSKRMV